MYINRMGDQINKTCWTMAFKIQKKDQLFFDLLSFNFDAKLQTK